jgi:hypothetical protein
MHGRRSEQKCVMVMTRMLAAASIRISGPSKLPRTRNMGTSLCPTPSLVSKSNERGGSLTQIKEQVTATFSYRISTCRRSDHCQYCITWSVFPRKRTFAGRVARLRTVSAYRAWGLVFVATMALISIFNPSWLVGHRFHDRSQQQTPTEKEMSVESARLMIKPTRGLWHFCYSE